MENIKEIFQQTIELLNSRFIRHQYMSFPSGAIMLDIWYEGKFYVIQFQDYVGYLKLLKRIRTLIQFQMKDFIRTQITRLNWPKYFSIKLISNSL